MGKGRWIGIAILIFTGSVWSAARAGDQSHGPEAWQGLAFRARSLPGGGQPFDIVATDLDGDGQVDLAVTNPTQSRVSVYRGRGTGAFSGPEHFRTRAFPRGIVAGDFNGDGWQDLAIAATNANHMVIHDGLGGGRFASPRAFRIGSRPFHATSADFNGDGLLDLAVANETATASVLLGDGRGGFSVKSYETDKWPSAVAAGDFDEDGHVDLAVTNWGANNVSILPGNGDGSFAEPRNFTYKGHALYCVLAVDLDRDGHMDMVWNDIARQGLYILYGDGRGDFPRTRLLPAGGGVRSAVAADLDGDGWLDLASANSATGNASIMLADGRGGFLPTQQVPVGVVPRVVTAADVNGDLRPDLIVTNTKSNDITVLLNEGPTLIRAGAALAGPPEDTGPVKFTGFNVPKAVALDPAGNVLVADQANHRIAHVDRTTGAVTTFAGTGRAGSAGDGGPAVAAELNSPSGLAVDASGAVFIADFANNRVRKVEPSGLITTIAGTGQMGYSGDGGPASNAQLNHPFALAVDSAGSLYIADFGNNRIRKVDPGGVITTVVGTGAPRHAGDGGPAVAASIGPITGMAFDPDGNLLITDQVNTRIRTLHSDGTITTVVGGGSYDEGGDPMSATVVSPAGVAVDAAGAIYVTEPTRNRIRRIIPPGIIETVAGTGEQGYAGAGGAAIEAKLWAPAGIAVTGDGMLVFADSANDCIQQIDAAGIITTVAGQPRREAPITFTQARAVAAAAVSHHAQPAATPPQLEWEHRFRSGSDANAPYGIAIGNMGEVYVAGDVGSGADWRMMRLTPEGRPTWSFEVATKALEVPSALTVTRDGQVVAAGHYVGRSRRDYLVISVSTAGKENWRYTRELRGDQIAKGITAGRDDNLYIAGESNRTVEVFSLGPAGKLRWTYRGEEGGANALAVDARGDLLVAGSGRLTWRVIKLRADGSLVWEHSESSHLAVAVEGIAVDGAGNSIVTGSWDMRPRRLLVLKVDPNGTVLWSYLDEQEPHGLIGRAVATDDAGNAIVVGETTEDWILLSLDPAGELRWRFTYDGGGTFENRDQVFAVAHHPSGGFITSGFIHPLPPQPPSRGQVDWRIARYKPAIVVESEAPR